MISLMLVEDNEIVRRGLSKYFNQEPDINVVFQAASGSEAISRLNGGIIADLAIIDWNMPDMSGLELTRLIKERFPDVKVLILTMHGKREYKDKAKAEGAMGYILKEMEFEVLAAAVRRVAGGEEVFI